MFADRLAGIAASHQNVQIFLHLPVATGFYVQYNLHIYLGESRIGRTFDNR